MEAKIPRKIILDPEVKQVTGLSRPSRWRMAQRGEFPEPVRLSSGRVGYFQDEIVAWQDNLVRASQSKIQTPVSPGRNGHPAMAKGIHHG